MKKRSIEPGGVDEYIAKCPKGAQGRLRKIRAAIREAAPGSIETVSYFRWPGYRYEGDYDYNGMFAWFSFKEPNVRLHVRLPVIQDHKKELAGYETTKAVVFFHAGEEIPSSLVKKLVRASIKAMEDGRG